MSDDKMGQTIISGFVFENAAEAVQAARKAEGVKYIREKTDMENPGMVLQIYNKMVQQKLFETAVGFSFLKSMQEYLKTFPSIPEEEILPIPVQHPVLEESLKQNKREKAPQKKREKAANPDYKARYRAARALCIVLAVCVAAMFAITATSGNTTILNYETELIDKYEAWEQELSEREAALKEREAALDAEGR